MMKVFVLLGALVAAVTVYRLTQSERTMPQEEVRTVLSVEEAHTMMSNDTSVVMLDVRTLEEYSGPLGHVPNSLLIPIQELAARLAEMQPHKEKTILAICRTGRRSGIATDILRKVGYRAYNVDGGMVAWNEKKFRVEK